jgi:predicted PurR-regulated permease PerM
MEGEPGSAGLRLGRVRRVQVIVALTVGLVIWIVLWALGVKSFDGFLITMLLVVVAATARIVEPFIRERLRP